MIFEIKTLLFSDDSDIAGEIKKILNKKDFDIQVTDSYENFIACINDVKLIILNISEKNTGDIANIENVLKNTGRMDIARFALLNLDQSNLLFESGIKFDGFCFLARIKKELAVRIKEVLLRKGIYPPVNSIVVNGLVLNLDKYELTINDKPAELTFKEFELLKLLLQNQDKVFTRNKLLSIVWEYDFYGGSRTVDVHIRRLRSKIPPPYNLMLKTIRNVGYMFSPQI